MSRHRSQDEAPTDDLAILQPGDLVPVHLVGPAGDEGFFTGEVKAADNATGPPVVRWWSSRAQTSRTMES